MMAAATEEKMAVKKEFATKKMAVTLTVLR